MQLHRERWDARRTQVKSPIAEGLDQAVEYKRTTSERLQWVERLSWEIDQNQTHKGMHRFQQIDSWNEGEQKAPDLLSSNIDPGAGETQCQRNGWIEKARAYWGLRMSARNSPSTLGVHPPKWAARKGDTMLLWNERNNKMLPTQKGECKGRVLREHSCLGHTWNLVAAPEGNFVCLDYLRCYKNIKRQQWENIIHHDSARQRRPVAERAFPHWLFLWSHGQWQEFLRSFN